LRYALQHARLILITAPAGAGKTTLLTTALAELPRTSAWVSLDTDDNDLARFLSVLLAALEQLAPGIRATAGIIAHILEEHQSDQTTQVRQAISSIINTLLELSPTPGLLILDDLHVIHEPLIHKAIEYLIEQLPMHLTLAIATRHDPPLPLARLRARRELLELRLAELRFTTEETVALLTGCLGLPLSATEVTTLHQRTEGWAAGLSLLADSLTPLESPEQRIRLLSHLAQTERYLFDYLAEEVLNQQDSLTRSFLLETAILSELTPQICQSLTGRSDASMILEHLYRRNLFLIKIQSDPAIGNDQATYRYHDLFRAFLQEHMRRGDPALLRELHRRAAGIVGDPLRAIDHLCHAELWDAAADQIESIGDGLLARGAHHILQSTIDMLPESMRAARPRLRYLLGICAWQRWDSGTAIRLLEYAANDFARLGDTIRQGEALVFLSTALGHAGSLARARETAEQALFLPLHPARRVQLLASRAWQNLVGGEWPQAAADLDEAMAIVERTHDTHACSALTVALRGSLISLPGAIERIARFSRLIVKLAPPNNRELYAAAAAMRAWAAIWLDNWEIAEAETQSALDLLSPTDPFSIIHAEIFLQQPVCAALSGQTAQADTYIARLLAALEPQGGMLRTERLLSFLHMIARIRWLQGRYEDLRAIYARMTAALPSSVWPSDAVLCREIGALLHLVDGRGQAAIADLTIAAEDQTRLMVAPILGDPRLHLAYAYLQANMPEQAAAIARPVLTAIRREGMPGRLRWQGSAIVIPILRLFVEDGGSHAEFAATTLARLEPEMNK